MAKVQVKISINKLDANHADYSSNLKELCIQAVISGAKVSSDTDNAYYIIDSKNLPMALAQAVVSLGAEISNYPFFIKVVPENIVPLSLPESSFVDEEGLTQQKTWAQWKLPNFDFHTMANGFVYVAGEAYSAKETVFNDFIEVFNDCIDVETFKSMPHLGE